MFHLLRGVSKELVILIHEGGGVGIPQDGAVQGLAVVTEKVIGLEPLLIQTQDVERDSPILQEADDIVELVVSPHEVTRGVVPLIANNQENSVRPEGNRPSGSKRGQSESKKQKGEGQAFHFHRKMHVCSSMRLKQAERSISNVYMSFCINTYRLPASAYMARILADGVST